jgi:hypothetical protein
MDYYPYTPVYTFREVDYKDCISLRRIFLEVADPTEYHFAMLVFESWDFWEKLSKARWFQPHIEKWHKVLNIKMRSEAIGNMMHVAAHSGEKGVSAAKWIAEGKWRGAKPRDKAGKEEMIAEDKHVVETLAAGSDLLEAFRSNKGN